MKNWFLGVLMVAVASAFVPEVAEAKRLGGGMSKGMQRSAPAKPPAQHPAQPAQPSPAPQTPAMPAAATAGATAAAAGTAAKRSWMGPVAGLAAGLGLAALASHLGFGEELASFMLLALLGVAAVVVIRLLMRRMGGGQPALAGAAAGSAGSTPTLNRAPLPQGTPAAASGGAAPASPAFSGLQIGQAVPAGQLPPDFDREGFERIAKMIFIRMQAAHDAGDLDDLRQFTTPELFADIRVDLQDRGATSSHTDVLAITPEVQDFAEEDGRQVVSVRYTGQVREHAGADPSAVDETWHLVRPVDGSRNWAIAGIQQAA